MPFFKSLFDTSVLAGLWAVWMVGLSSCNSSWKILTPPTSDAWWRLLEWMISPGYEASPGVLVAHSLLFSTSCSLQRASPASDTQCSAMRASYPVPENNCLLLPCCRRHTEFELLSPLCHLSIYRVFFIFIDLRDLRCQEMLISDF